MASKKQKTEVLKHPAAMNESEKKTADAHVSLNLRPKVDPALSCPPSVLYLPYVIEGIKNGEIIATVELIPNPTDHE